MVPNMRQKNDLNVTYARPVMRKWYTWQELTGAIIAALIIAIPFAIYFWYTMPSMVDTAMRIDNTEMSNDKNRQ